jgi:RNA polymerase sigma-70 factor, ECF subfamily
VRGPRTESARPAQWRGTIDVGSDGNLVRDAVARLSDWDRAVIYRSYYLGRTTTQIAAEFRTDDELVKHDLHRALHALRTTLQQRDDITRRRLRVV